MKAWPVLFLSGDEPIFSSESIIGSSCQLSRLSQRKKSKRFFRRRTVSSKQKDQKVSCAATSSQWFSGKLSSHPGAWIPFCVRSCGSLDGKASAKLKKTGHSWPSLLTCCRDLGEYHSKTHLNDWFPIFQLQWRPKTFSAQKVLKQHLPARFLHPTKLSGGLIYSFIFTPNLWDMIQFHYSNIFQMLNRLV